LKIDVAVRVAATEIIAVVAAAVIISVDGIGTVMSVNGTSTICTSFALGVDLSGDLSSFSPLTPGGGRRSLGGTTRGL